MTTQPTIFISGWAHGAEAMRPLAAAMGVAQGLQPAGFAESATRLSPAELLADATGNLKLENGGERAAELVGVRVSPCESVAVRDASLSPYALALVARLRSAPAPVALVGWSTGGMIALEAALALPEKVSRLVLVSATARFCATDGYPCGLPAGNLRALAAGVARQPEAALKGFFELASAPEPLAADMVAAKVAVAMGQGAETLKHGLAYLRDCDLRESLRHCVIASPTDYKQSTHDARRATGGFACLIIHGREDRVIPCGAAEFLAATIPGARLVLLDGAGHDLPERHAAVVAATVENSR